MLYHSASLITDTTCGYRTHELTVSAESPRRVRVLYTMPSDRGQVHHICMYNTVTEQAASCTFIINDIICMCVCYLMYDVTTTKQLFVFGENWCNTMPILGSVLSNIKYPNLLDWTLVPSVVDRIVRNSWTYVYHISPTNLPNKFLAHYNTTPAA